MRDRLSDLIHNFPGARVLVYGDFVLDQFVFGEISRVSREAPVLILRYVETRVHPGGGGNAAANLAALGCGVSAVGLTGEDDSAAKLKKGLPEPIDASGLVTLTGYQTPTKTRILAGSLHSPRQQVVRLDVEQLAPVSPMIEEQLWNRLAQRLDHCNVVVVSDYGLGSVQMRTLARLGDLARQRQVPVLVDSRFRFAEISAVTGATPNISEFEEAAGVKVGSNVELLEATGKKSRAEKRLDFLLITRGRFGMSLFEPDDRVTHIPIYGSDEVADVTGAGDTVIAALAAALAAGATYFEAAMLSNYAGGIVVMKHGTATVSAQELLEAVRVDTTE